MSQGTCPSIPCLHENMGVAAMPAALNSVSDTSNSGNEFISNNTKGVRKVKNVWP
jgi:hypothetical protein